MPNKIKTVADIPDTYTLIMIDYDVNELNQQYDQDYGCYFALIEDGCFIDLYGCEGNIPYMYKAVYHVDIV
jgi:hypothetical protein